MSEGRNPDQDEEEFNLKRYFYFPLVSSILIFIFGGGFIIAESLRIRAPLHKLLWMSPEVAQICIISVMDILVLLGGLSGFRVIWIERSLKITRNGVRKIDFWGRRHFVKWSDIVEVRASSVIILRSGTDFVEFNPIYFTDMQELRATLESKIPWYDAEDGVLVRNWHWGQMIRVHRHPARS